MVVFYTQQERAHIAFGVVTHFVTTIRPHHHDAALFDIREKHTSPVQFEYINPLAGLALVIIGLIVLGFVDISYGVPMILVGLFFIVYYRKYLLEMLGV